MSNEMFLQVRASVGICPLPSGPIAFLMQYPPGMFNASREWFEEWFDGRSEVYWSDNEHKTIFHGRKLSEEQKAQTNYYGIALFLPCGESRHYRTVQDIPVIDIPCPCGNPQHWMVKYQEMPDAAHIENVGETLTG